MCTFGNLKFFILLVFLAKLSVTETNKLQKLHAHWLVSVGVVLGDGCFRGVCFILSKLRLGIVMGLAQVTLM